MWYQYQYINHTTVWQNNVLYWISLVGNIGHYPFFKRDVLDFYFLSTSHFTKYTFYDRFIFSLSKKTPRSEYLTIHTLRACISQYNPMGMYWTCANKPRQELLSECIRLGPMLCRTILSPFRTRVSHFVQSCRK